MTPRVLHLIDSFHQGGSERQAVQLARMQHESGACTVRVAALDASGVLKPEVERLSLGPIHEFRLRSFHHPSTIRQVRRFATVLRDEAVDVLHAHDFYTNIFGMAAGLVAGVPVRIASRREIDPGRTSLQRFVERRAFDVAHAIVVNAEAIRQDLVAHGIPDRKIRTIYNGVDPSRFSTTASSSRAEALASFGLPQDARRQFVTILANLRLELKDHRTFLLAAQQVKAVVPDAAFVVAGEGELLEPMRELARQLGIEGDVFFTGRCDRVPALLSISDVCVLSSVSEGFANVLIEYMTAGRPVVTTDVGGAREAVIDGENGYLVAPRDARVMADRIASLLLDGERRERMGAKGRERALATFSSTAQLERSTTLYADLLARAGTHSRAGKVTVRNAGV
jgi:L-malate glycosyltransferase